MNRTVTIIGGVIAILVILFLFRDTNFSSSQKTSGKVQVTASFYPLWFFSSEIGGEKAQVRNITPSGAEPHDYEPTTKDIAEIEKSNMLVLNGGVEGWGDKIRDNLKGKNVVIVVAGEGLFTQTIEEGGKKQTDPHVWLDPILARREAHNITTKGYLRIDGTNSDYYQNNEKRLNAQFEQLDKEYREGLQNCKQKDIITSHAAFGYLAARYGLNQIPISGLTPDAEPSSQQLAEVAKFAKEHNVKYIFFESLVSPKLAQTIAQEVGAKTLVLDPIEGLTDDDIKQGKNYFTVMEENLKNLRIALECK